MVLGFPNDPDPYVKILHFCNNPEGEEIELPIFRTFLPDRHDVGLLPLDGGRAFAGGAMAPPPQNMPPPPRGRPNYEDDIY